ncbi:MAG TPA: hypothetical protein PLP07_01230 [Pyrinomonadaceae bacterium]|nr:hypothetical protein [Chloracidobacterium sp.]MBP9936388.1 hypothetical protein [Pyrinomonadaceae bacterium]MBK7802909.1 hypothetical protein [Chloracidobacterium sp.]MBK9768883.1 hypothetical protein [Chloracidobacterium sp.]MBL0240672.1 hypothetical protein [Chloracidobacterium sp.]
MSNENKNLERFPDLSDDEKRVSDLLGTLKQVEAPGDFDVRVRARIAQGRPSSSAATWMPSWARYAVPLVLAAAIGGYVAVDRYTRPVETGDPDLARTAVAETPLPPPANSVEISNTVAAILPTESRANNLPPKSNTALPKPTETLSGRDADTSGGGSFVEAVRPGKRILPRGIDPNAAQPIRPRDFDTNTKIPVDEVLTVIGVKARYQASNWTVESVADHSKAGDAGILPGDVIETINDQTLVEKTTFSGKFVGRSIKVRRAGKTVVIDLIRK